MKSILSCKCDMAIVTQFLTSVPSYKRDVRQHCKGDDAILLQKTTKNTTSSLRYFFNFYQRRRWICSTKLKKIDHECGFLYHRIIAVTYMQTSRNLTSLVAIDKESPIRFM